MKMIALETLANMYDFEIACTNKLGRVHVTGLYHIWPDDGGGLAYCNLRDSYREWMADPVVSWDQLKDAPVGRLCFHCRQLYLELTS